MPSTLQDSELILTPEGAIYHLALCPDQLATNVILVGDPSRVPQVSKFFSVIHHKVSHREFVTHTGLYRQKPVSVLSTGIGTDNIDIVLNELDALVNIDLRTKKIKPTKTSLSIIRLGTSGGLRAELGINSFVRSDYALGLDNLIYYYQNYESVVETKMTKTFLSQTGFSVPYVMPYVVAANDELLRVFPQEDIFKGITATAPGFYGPQGRQLRLACSLDSYHEVLTKYQHQGLSITNFEMETSAFYALSKLLGHKALTLCVIIANRASKQFSKTYQESMDKLIERVLQQAFFS